ncbi:uncharacterized protein LOC130650392 [Hydractinia symbiolongicarpus]|uniref:uncharacterized protein LOC130650392 n=1 Tax=Hydractinia symbiolongicarpus TaxID=13093 RepID=UPI00254C11C2|nr:uncharacterized protein LOC130650349 isoform X1 [Hydractinia symbiolongicarpus]XP_057312034.1 uncharacterized protein LOC130650392 [Hydractinia symbiolongicarpus]
MSRYTPTKYTPSKSNNAAVNYYYHFRKDFLAPYGLAHSEKTFSDADFAQKLNDINCEFYCRPQVAISEMASSIVENLEYVIKNTQCMEEKNMSRFITKIQKIFPSLNVINSKANVDGDIKKALEDVKKCLTSESLFLDTFIEEGLRFASSLYLSLIWLRAGKFVMKNPEIVLQKLHPAATGFTQFKRDVSADAYVQDIATALGALNLTSPTKESVKRKLLIDIPSSDEEEMYMPPKKKVNNDSDNYDDETPDPSKRKFKHESDSEDVNNEPHVKKNKKSKKSKKQKKFLTDSE